jgi:hypothetical protein
MKRFYLALLAMGLFSLPSMACGITASYGAAFSYSAVAFQPAFATLVVPAPCATVAVASFAPAVSYAPAVAAVNYSAVAVQPAFAYGAVGFHSYGFNSAVVVRNRGFHGNVFVGHNRAVVVNRAPRVTTSRTVIRTRTRG